MNLIKNSLLLVLKEAFPWIPLPLGGQLPIRLLHNDNGFYVFEFFFHYGKVNCYLKAFVFDLVDRPDFRTYFEGIKRITAGSNLNFDNRRYEIFYERIFNDLGIFLCVDEEKNKNVFIEIMRSIRFGANISEQTPDFWKLNPGIWYDKNTNKIVGATSYVSALREFAAAKALTHFWKLEFSIPCPVPLALGVHEIKDLSFFDNSGNFVKKVSLQDAFTHPYLRDAPVEWRRLGAIVFGLTDIEDDFRLDNWASTSETIEGFDAEVKKFIINIANLIKIAHKYLGGSFSTEYSSALTSTNVTPVGEVVDLETFYTTANWYLDGNKEFNLSTGIPVDSKYQIMDLALMIELIAIFLSKGPFRTKDLELDRYILMAFEIYTEAVASQEFINLLKNLEFDSPSISSAVNLAYKLAATIFQEVKWTRYEQSVSGN